jgi:tetrahydromethanopterin S-methyltransferase subunit G
MTTQSQKAGDSGKSYDRELVIIFGVMLGLMLIVIVIGCEVNGNFKINSTVFFKSSFLFLRFGVEAL